MKRYVTKEKEGHEYFYRVCVFIENKNVDKAFSRYVHTYIE